MNANRRLLYVFTLIVVGACNRDPKVERDKYFNDAQRYLAARRYSEAAIQFRNALSADEGHIPSYFGLAEVLKKTGDDEGAINAYRKVVNLDSTSIPARLEVGRYLLRVAASNPELFKTVQLIAREVIALQPSNIEGHVLLGNAYSGLGEIDESIKELDAAVSQDPEHLQATLSLAAAYLRARNPAEAERLFTLALDKHPQSIEALLAAATFFAGTQRYGEAEERFKKAFELAPDDARCLYGLASLYSSTNRSNEAVRIFSEAVRRKPDAREAYWGLANLYFQQGANDKGIAVLTDLLKAKPGDRQAQVRLAEVYLNAKQQAKAQELLQSVLATYPNDAEAHAIMGRLLRERNEVDSAMAQFDLAIKGADSLIPPYIEKANLQMLAGHVDSAAETLISALQRDKNNPLVRGFLAKVFALQQKPQDALREAAIVLSVMPNNEDALVARGDAFVKLGNFEEAVKQFRRLTELRPSHPFYWHRLGTAEALHGETTSATLHLRKAVELKPDLEPAIVDLVVLHSRSKQYDEAIRELDRLPNSSIPTDEIHRLRGQVYAAKGDPIGADREFRKAIEINPTGYSNYMALAELSLTRKDQAQAIREIDQLIAKTSKLPQSFFLKAYLLQMKNDPAGAVASYRRVLELDPENPDASNNLAWLLSDDPRSLSEALGLAQKARRNRPADPGIADTLGWVYYKMKNYTLAVDQLLFSVNNRTQPGAEHYYRLGAAYYEKGDVERAKPILLKALQLNPSFAGAENARRLLGLGR